MWLTTYSASVGKGTTNLGTRLRREIRNLLPPGLLTPIERAIVLEIADACRDDDGPGGAARTGQPGMAWILEAAGAASEKKVGEALASIARKWVELRVPLGIGRDGKAYYSVASVRTTYRFPSGAELEARALELATGDSYIPAGRIRPGRTALYRWYDAEGALLYIGITGHLPTRQAIHAKNSAWSEFAALSRVEHHADRATAEAAEVAAILAEMPIFNRQHNDTPEARGRLVDYLAQHGRLDLLAADSMSVEAAEQGGYDPDDVLDGFVVDDEGEAA